MAVTANSGTKLLFNIKAIVNPEWWVPQTPLPPLYFLVNQSPQEYQEWIFRTAVSMDADLKDFYAAIIRLFTSEKYREIFEQSRNPIHAASFATAKLLVEDFGTVMSLKVNARGHQFEAYIKDQFSEFGVTFFPHKVKVLDEVKGVYIPDFIVVLPTGMLLFIEANHYDSHSSRLTALVSAYSNHHQRLRSFIWLSEGRFWTSPTTTLARILPSIPFSTTTILKSLLPRLIQFSSEIPDDKKVFLQGGIKTKKGILYTI